MSVFKKIIPKYQTKFLEICGFIFEDCILNTKKKKNYAVIIEKIFFFNFSTKYAKRNYKYFLNIDWQALLDFSYGFSAKQIFDISYPIKLHILNKNIKINTKSDFYPKFIQPNWNL